MVKEAWENTYVLPVAIADAARSSSKKKLLLVPVLDTIFSPLLLEVKSGDCDCHGFVNLIESSKLLFVVESINVVVVIFVCFIRLPAGGSVEGKGGGSNLKKNLTY